MLLTSVLEAQLISQSLQRNNPDTPNPAHRLLTPRQSVPTGKEAPAHSWQLLWPTEVKQYKQVIYPHVVLGERKSLVGSVWSGRLCIA